MTERDIQTIILAGGVGKRAEIPYSKTLIRTSDDKTILEHMLNDLTKAGIKTVTIITNTIHYPQIKETIEKEIRPEIQVNLEDNEVTDPNKTLGAIGDLLLAYEKNTSKQNQDITHEKKIGYLVLPCDTAYEKSTTTEEFLKFVESNGYEFTTIACDVEDRSLIENRFGCMEVDKQGILTGFEEKPGTDLAKSSLRAVPIYFIPEEYFKLLQKYKENGGNLDSPGMMIPFLLKEKVTIVVCITGDNIIDAGVPDDIKRANRY